MAKTAHSLGATTFQFFSSNPRSARGKEWAKSDIEAFKSAWDRPFVAHAPYILNLASTFPEKRQKAISAMQSDLKRIMSIDCPYYNIHPGCHLGTGSEKGTSLVAEGLDQILDQGCSSMILLETMAGKGTELGRTLEELARIRHLSQHENQIGYLVDTCHVWDAGYDLRDGSSFISLLDRVLGLENIHAIHLNDSMNPLASHKDRHQKLGKGCIGFDALASLTCNPALSHLPFILETPGGLPTYQVELKLLRGYCP
jgi:deoxyribonuclease-4